MLKVFLPVYVKMVIIEMLYKINVFNVYLNVSHVIINFNVIHVITSNYNFLIVYQILTNLENLLVFL